MNKEQLKKALLRYKFFWTACCLVLIANVAGYMTIIRSQRNKIDELHNQYVKIRRQNVPPTQKGDDTTAQYLKVKGDVKTFVDMLPPVVTVADKVRELNAALGKHNFSVDKMTFRPIRTSTLSLWKYTTAFTVTGKYSELKVLLADIQNLRGLFCIEKLILNRSKDQERISMTLGIATYFK